MSKRKGYNSVTPYLVVDDVKKAIEYYAKHLNAKELYRLEMPNGKIAHAEMQIGDSKIMMSDEFPEMGIIEPEKDKNTSVSFTIYVDKVDHVFQSMIDDGSQELFAVQNQFHGDRSGKLKDPFGHIWFLSENFEEQTPAQIIENFGKMITD